MNYQVYEKFCNGCKKCLQACPFGAIVMVDEKARILECCIDCGACVDSCTFDAIGTIDESSIGTTNIDLYKNIWVIAEQRNGTVAKVSRELLGKARELAEKIGTRVESIIIGHNIKALTKDMIAHGADTVYIADDTKLKDYRTGTYTRVIVDLIAKHKPEIILFGATNIGRDLAPRVAQRIMTGLTADCTELDIDECTRQLLQTRPAFGGNIMATILCPNHRPQMATIRPGVMKEGTRDDSRKGIVKKVSVVLDDYDQNTVIKEIIKAVRARVNLADAKIIVSGGRGVRGSDGFKMIEKLANSIDTVLSQAKFVL